MKLPRFTGKEVERRLLGMGWYLHHSKGAHFYDKHPRFPGKRVTIPMHGTETLAPNTLKSILQQAGLSVEDFIKLL